MKVVVSIRTVPIYAIGTTIWWALTWELFFFGWVLEWRLGQKCRFEIYRVLGWETWAKYVFWNCLQNFLKAKSSGGRLGQNLCFEVVICTTNESFLESLYKLKLYQYCNSQVLLNSTSLPGKNVSGRCFSKPHMSKGCRPTAWRDFCGSKKNSVYWFDLFFYVRNDSASGVEDFGILFFANRQFFLKFSKIGKKINFEPFFMHISL